MQTSMMFGDNESVVNSATIPHSKLHRDKRHNALSYHRTREAIAAKILRFEFIRSETNPADTMSKHWDLASIWAQLRPILFWEGDTALIKAHDEWKHADLEAKRLADEADKAREAKSKSTDSNAAKGSGAPASS